MTFFSSFSASNIMEQAGSMIRLRNTMCTGQRISGRLAKKTGISDSPAMGTWIAKIYARAFEGCQKFFGPSAPP